MTTMTAGKTNTYEAIKALQAGDIRTALHYANEALALEADQIDMNTRVLAAAISMVKTKADAETLKTMAVCNDMEAHIVAVDMDDITHETREITSDEAKLVAAVALEEIEDDQNGEWLCYLTKCILDMVDIEDLESARMTAKAVSEYWRNQLYQLEDIENNIIRPLVDGENIDCENFWSEKYDFSDLWQRINKEVVNIVGSENADELIKESIGKYSKISSAYGLNGLVAEIMVNSYSNNDIQNMLYRLRHALNEIRPGFCELEEADFDEDEKIITKTTRVEIKKGSCLIDLYVKRHGTDPILIMLNKTNKKVHKMRVAFNQRMTAKHKAAIAEMGYKIIDQFDSTYT